MTRRSKRKNSLLRPRLLLVSSGPTERSIKPVQIKRLLERFSLHNVRVVRRAMGDWPDTLLSASEICISNQLKTDFDRDAISKSNHLAKLPSGIDMHQWKRDWARKKCLLR